MIHIFATSGSESCDDCARGAVGLDGPPSRMRPRNRFRQLRSWMIATLDNLPHLTTFPDGFVDGGACSAAQPPQNAAFGATRIVNGPAARRAGSFSIDGLLSKSGG